MKILLTCLIAVLFAFSCAQKESTTETSALDTSSEPALTTMPSDEPAFDAQATSETEKAVKNTTKKKSDKKSKKKTKKTQ